MIFSKQSTSFEATVEGFATGLTGTIGVRLLDNVGGTVIARTTAGIAEFPAGSGFYTVTMTAPASMGQYTVMWDSGSVTPDTTAYEDLVVQDTPTVTVTTPPAPTPVDAEKMSLADFDQELIDAGFDSIPQPRRYRWINFAYNRIASKFPWLWEQAIIPVTMAPGSSYFTLAGAGADILNFRSVDHVYVTTANFRKKLKRLDNDKAFYDTWLSQDLTVASVRSEPTWYRVYNNRLYILPPPQTTRTFEIHIHQRTSQLVAPTDKPVTPRYLDQAIMLATFSEAHKRTYEIQLAAQDEVDLGDWVDQMKIDEEWLEPEELERTVPDDTWL